MPSAFPRLSNRQHSVVRACRETARGRGEAGVVLLDGAHLLAEAIAADLRLRLVVVSTDVIARGDRLDLALVERAASVGAAIHEAPPAVIDAASPVKTSTGFVALADWSPAPLPAVFSPAPALALGLVDVQDPGNVGSAIRSADGLGATGVVAIDATAHPGHWKTLRGAMGSTFHLPVARAPRAEALAAARKAGVQVLAAVATHAEPMTAADFTRPTLVLVGNEGAGLPVDVVSAADAAITIPMRASTNSLNVAVTAGIVLYEARRQRQA